MVYEWASQPNLKLMTKNQEHTTDNREFSPQLLNVLSEPPSPLPRLVLILLMVLVALIVAWSFWGQLDIVARAQGKLIPQNRIKVVQPLEGGRIKSILVKEGDRVEQGHSLLVMDAELYAADTEKIENEVALLGMQLRRVETELSGSGFEKLPEDDPALYTRIRQQLEVNIDQYQSKKAEYQSALSTSRESLESARKMLRKTEKLLPIYRESEQAYEKLVRSGNSGRLQLLEKRKERIEAEQNLEAQKHKIQEVESAIEQHKSRLKSLVASYKKGLVQERVEYERTLSSLIQEQQKQQYRNNQLTLKAPEDGVIQTVAVSTAGSVVPSGTVLLTMVPTDDPLKAEVMVSGTDIGFVEVGQKAKLKLTAYSFQRYGMIEGEVTHISPNSLSNQQNPMDNPGALGYKAIVQLDHQTLQNQGRSFPLRAGMGVSAEINTGKRTVIEYLLSPVKKVVSEAASER